MLSVIFRQHYVQANAQGIINLVVFFCVCLFDIFWSILDANIKGT